VNKPVILTVDDDAEVLSAIGRDLRAQYQASYKIIKASSGSDALDATRQLKERGSAIALFVVDERMPGMTGTEFLTEAIKLVPDARRVLLTAYADTETAIRAINLIGLDHYLLKPWAPPGERLYPVLDDLLEDWQQKTPPPFEGIRVAGTSLSRSSFEVRSFLASNQVPYLWIDLERDEPARELALTVSPELAQLPVVWFPDGKTMVQPETRAIAAHLRMQMTAREEMYDLVIVGGGPAGLAAAVYGASEGMKTVLVERSATGGQAGTSSRIENYLGFPTGSAGQTCPSARQRRPASSRRRS
jgi:thioredoxin reductase (NADPH)